MVWVTPIVGGKSWITHRIWSRQDELEEYLSDRGLELRDDIGAADYQEIYLEPLGRVLHVFDGERVAYATAKGVLEA